jgi:uncharacterized protein DUF397
MGQAEASAPAWHKSSRCDSGTCVEVAWLTEGVAVRDNTMPETQLSFDSTSWRHLVRELRGGQLDR